MPPTVSRIARAAQAPTAVRTIERRKLAERLKYECKLFIAYASFIERAPASRRQWRIDKGERRLAFHIVDLAHAEHRAQAVGRHLERTRRGRRPRGRLRISGGPGRM